MFWVILECILLVLSFCLGGPLFGLLQLAVALLIVMISAKMNKRNKN